MSSIGDRIRAARLAKKLERNELASAIGVSYTTIELIENHKTEMPRLKNLKRIARVLDVTVEWLQTGNEGDRVPVPGIAVKRYIPILSWSMITPWVQVGVESLSKDYEDYLPMLNNQGSTKSFALCIEDNTCAPVIKSGDYVVIEPSKEPSDGSIVAIRVSESSGKVRKLVKTADKIYLEPLDRYYPMEEFRSSDSIVGCVIGYVGFFQQ
jgi:SOS-response transcriptional repressor LexA